jgi:murein DD-endopeptidase MepM/ murein hydrolase activator NlpD
VPAIRPNAIVAAAAVALALLVLPAAASAAPTFGVRTLEKGMSGPDVRTMQQLLMRTGAQLTADGEFGRRTARALLHFERDEALKADARLTKTEAPVLAAEAQARTADSEATPGVPAVGGAVPGAAPEADAEPADTAAAVFPIRGRHELGRGASNGFGGGRGHQGQDVFAACGTPIVAAQSGTVQMAEYHPRAGNYVVITTRTGESHAYMHLRRPASVAVDDDVQAGDEIGEVGQTGRASGCHLHFELWTAPGYYTGGHPIDPLPALKRWDGAGAAARKARARAG